MTTRVDVVDAIDQPWLSLDPVQIGDVPAGVSTPDQYFLVSESGVAAVRIDYYRSTEEAYCFRATEVWHGWIVLGLGERVYLIDRASRDVRQFALGSYFGGAWPAPGFLLVTSAECVFKLGREGTLLWRSPVVGIDGVVIRRVADDLVHGEGEWDPPGDWRPFQLALESGVAA